MANNTNNINELLSQGTIIPQKSVGIHIYEIAITQKGDWINKYPDYVVFGINEADTGKPPEGKTCMFCKEQPAIHSVTKIMSSDGQFAGWHYCADCKTRY